MSIVKLIDSIVIEASNINIERQSLIQQGVFTFEQYIQQFSIRVALGRQLGHTTWVKERLMKDPNAILIHSSERIAKDVLRLTPEDERSARKRSKPFCTLEEIEPVGIRGKVMSINANYRGLERIDLSGKLIIVDVGLLSSALYHDERARTKALAEFLFESQYFLTEVRVPFSIVIVGS